MKTFELPSYWWLFPLALLLLSTIAAWKWRRHWRGILAMASVSILVLNLVFWPLCWRTQRGVDLRIYRRVSTEQWGGWILNVVILRGEVQIGVEKFHFDAGIVPPRPRLFALYSDFLDSPLSASEFSITKNSFLETILGVSVAWHQEPVNPVRHGSPVTFVLRFPQWLILPFCLLFPVVWARQWRRLRRLREQQGCFKCGYSLMGHAPGQNCPECGTRIPESLKPSPLVNTSSTEAQPHQDAS